MILQQTIITHCYCDNCSAGMLQTVLQISFEEKIANKDLVGRSIKCPNCQHENTVEDVFSIIPQEYLYISGSSIDRIKKDDGAKRFFDTE